MSIGRGVIIIFLCRKLFITNHRNKEWFFFCVSHHSATARLFRRRSDDLTMREFLNVRRRGIRIIRTPMASLTSTTSIFVAAIISFTMMRSLLVFKAPFAVGFISHRRSLFMMRRRRPWRGWGRRRRHGSLASFWSVTIISCWCLRATLLSHSVHWALLFEVG